MCDTKLKESHPIIRDDNGDEIHTGDIILIKGCPNRKWGGLFFVKASPGDPFWDKEYLLIHRISETGRISNYHTAKPESTWPVQFSDEDDTEYVKDMQKKLKKATIYLSSDLRDYSEVADYFLQESHTYQEYALINGRQYGMDSEEYLREKSSAEMMARIAHEMNKQSSPYRYYFDDDDEDD